MYNGQVNDVLLRFSRLFFSAVLGSAAQDPFFWSPNSKVLASGLVVILAAACHRFQCPHR